jgi:high affinity Mn2+ porin
MNCPFHKYGGITLMLLAAQSAQAQSTDADAWSVHAQATIVDQWHYGFHSPYEGIESLQGSAENKHTLSATLFLGYGVWKGGELYFDPELTQGTGLSGTQGIAAFPNGEATHASGTAPSFDVARLFFRQTIGLGGETEKLDDDENQVAEVQDVDRMVLTAGKLAATDVFDDNAFSHDPRTQFLNVALMDSGAWDFPADTKGYTTGFTAELNRKDWTLHYGIFMEPAEANGSALDKHLLKAWGQILQWDRRYARGNRTGTVRPFVFWNRADMGNYGLAVSDPAAHLDIVNTRAYRSKVGAGVSWDQELTSDLGAFARVSWNDGRTETWAFTEIDSSVAAGLSLQGTAWDRKDDTLGMAEVIDGLAQDHRRYLEAGGYDFSIGDGRLSYATEDVTECYYNWKPLSWMAVAADYQFVVNPAYNSSRGPVSIFGARVHCSY